VTHPGRRLKHTPSEPEVSSLVGENQVVRDSVISQVIELESELLAFRADPSVSDKASAVGRGDHGNALLSLLMCVLILDADRLHSVPPFPVHARSGWTESVEASERPLCFWIEVDDLRRRSDRDLRPKVGLARRFVARVAILQREFVRRDEAPVILTFDRCLDLL
jgi:hypothetical protein